MDILNKEVREFNKIEQVIEQLKNQLRELTEIQSYNLVHKTLFDLIFESKNNDFLLSCVVDYCARIDCLAVIESNVSINSFEHWLNIYFENNYIDEEQVMLVRGKIVGKYIPRRDYFNSFPIYGNRLFRGSHHVTAHKNPDVDTIIASFVSWMDSFSCRLTSNLHYWNVPMGEPSELNAYFLKKFFGKYVFSRLVRRRLKIMNMAIDLATTENMKIIDCKKDLRTIDVDDGQTMIIIDKDGFYLGNWYKNDVRLVDNIYSALVQQFQRFTENFSFVYTQENFENFVNSTKETLLFSCSNTIQCDTVKNLLFEVFSISDLEKISLASFFELIYLIDCPNIERAYEAYQKFLENLVVYETQEDFNKDFLLFHKQTHTLIKEALSSVIAHMNTLENALKIKKNILGLKEQAISHKTPSNEILAHLQHGDAITVYYPHKDKKMPVGIIPKRLLLGDSHGWVSFRDFSNYNEIDLESNIKLISIVDHHYMDIKTDSCINVNLAEVQSTNTLLAEMALNINKKYSTHGLTIAEIESNEKEIAKMSEGYEKTVLQRQVFTIKSTFETKTKYWVNVERELQEYYLFLVAILDDTDFMSKVSRRDLNVIRSLINKINVITTKNLRKNIFFDKTRDVSKELEKEELLQHPILKELCDDIYNYREKILNERIKSLDSEKIFEDCKEQKFSYLISQSKLLGNNYETFKKKRLDLMNIWIDFIDQHALKEKAFALQMNSTIKVPYEIRVRYDGQDEIWIYSNTEKVENLVALKHFLASFYHKVMDSNNQLVGCFIEGEKKVFDSISSRISLIPWQFQENNDLNNSLIVLKFDRATVNSRKKQITPYLLEL